MVLCGVKYYRACLVYQSSVSKTFLPSVFRGSRGNSNFRGGRGGGGTWNNERSSTGGDRGWSSRGNYRGNFRGGNFRGGYRGGSGNVGDFERSNATAAAAGGNY